MQLVSWALVTLTHTIKDVGDTVLLRLTARHFPGLIQAKDNAKIENLEQDCVVCLDPNAYKRISDPAAMLASVQTSVLSYSIQEITTQTLTESLQQLTALLRAKISI
ncbi:hypothetical protein PoB_006836500 [Plakobranchus ocellatus]|uniref:Uncharacterized protein n=1 Tax=Plakobranchus ocellatus TaxID=259542 RepID=A0AAV4DCQ0_9GAST|nr:hypothetical protein PoB_006836500 [Plakobranchus ocellatus]